MARRRQPQRRGLGADARWNTARSPRRPLRAAADHLDAALKEKHWDALVPDERGNAAIGLKPAVVMDVDETVLDNSPYQARLVRDGKEYDEATWDQWVAEKKAKPVPGVVDFAKAAAAKGVTMLYISNRAVHLKDATLANLRAKACR
jgi:predicted secreted acid phosphatase